MIRVLLCLVVLVGTAQATDWTGNTSETQTVAYQLGDVQAPDVPPPPVPDPDQAPLDNPVGDRYNPAPVRDEPSCAAPQRAEPSCAYRAVAPQCAVQCVQQVQRVVVQRVQCVQPVQQVQCVQEVACAQAECAQPVRQRARLLGRGRLCARHHRGGVMGYSAPVQAVYAAVEPTCGG
jgi:hypothetical protein